MDGEYEDHFVSRFDKQVEQQGDKRKPKQIVKMLIDEHQYSEDEYIGGIEAHANLYVHIPDLSGVEFPGRAHAVEEFARGNTKRFLVLRLGITEKTARRVLKLLKKKGFEATP